MERSLNTRYFLLFLIHCHIVVTIKDSRTKITNLKQKITTANEGDRLNEKNQKEDRATDDYDDGADCVAKFGLFTSQ